MREEESSPLAHPVTAGRCDRESCRQRLVLMTLVVVCTSPARAWTLGRAKSSLMRPVVSAQSLCQRPPSVITRASGNGVDPEEASGTSRNNAQKHSSRPPPKPRNLVDTLADVVRSTQNIEVRLDCSILWCHLLCRGLFVDVLTRPLKKVPGWTVDDLAMFWRLASSGSVLCMAWVASGYLTKPLADIITGRLKTEGLPALITTTAVTWAAAGPAWIVLVDHTRLLGGGSSELSLGQVMVDDTAQAVAVLVTMVVSRFVAMRVP